MDPGGTEEMGYRVRWNAFLDTRGTIKIYSVQWRWRCRLVDLATCL